MKRILCFIFGHSWTSKSLRGEAINATEQDSAHVIKLAIIDHAKMYCDRCGHVSEQSEKFAKDVLSS